MVNPVNSSLSRNDVSTIMDVSMGRRERQMTSKHEVSRHVDPRLGHLEGEARMRPIISTRTGADI